MMPVSMRGQVVWITGSSSGIGEHLAYALTKARCKLVLSARRREELERVKQACLELPGNCPESDILVLPFDVLDLDKHQELVEKVIEHFGRIDILVNNAAKGVVMKIEETPLELDREMIELLVISQIALTKKVVPYFLKQGKGHVAVTSSAAGKIGSAFAAPYCLGKFALHGYFESLRLEYYGEIDVTMICPGPVTSKFIDNAEMGGKTLPDALMKNMKFMSGERCAELMAVALANKVGEAWLMTQPILGMVYLAQYCPDTFRWIAGKMTKKMFADFK